MNKFGLPLFLSVLVGTCSSLAMSVELEVVLAQNANQEECAGSTKPGDLCLMVQERAAEYCESIGSRLPTTRDFAAYSVARGAKGILELNEISQLPLGKAPEGYYLVDNLNPQDQRDTFYFSHEGFDPAKGPSRLGSFLGASSFWTASVVPTHPDFAHVFYAAWGGGGGEPSDHHRSKHHGVACIALE